MPPSIYLVTLSTHRRRFVLLGERRDIAAHALGVLPRRCPGLAVDCAVVTPDRVFAIVRVPKAVALTPIVQAYKAATTRMLKAIVAIDHVWDKGYQHRAIRDEAELISVRALLKRYEGPITLARCGLPSSAPTGETR
jgi:REP element-mobilizing transposase RayT